MKRVKTQTYRENTPECAGTKFKCRECGMFVRAIVFSDYADMGICACPWTAWTLFPSQHGYQDATRSSIAAEPGSRKLLRK